MRRIVELVDAQMPIHTIISIVVDLIDHLENMRGILSEFDTAAEAVDAA